jgi:ribose 5-phosphate isomerase A
MQTFKMQNMNKLSQQQIKKRLGQEAAKLIQKGMHVGLGTGTTSHCFIEALAQRCREEQLNIVTTASSKASSNLALQLGLKVVDLDSIGTLDMTIDGADEVDPQKRLIKGAGGAHLREKIVAAKSEELVIIIDESKLVDQLGKHKLPVEIVPFGHECTKIHLEALGVQATWRQDEQHSLFVTDNSHYLLDLRFPSPLDSPEEWDQVIRSIPGVVETGFFFNLASRILIGFADGQIGVRD